MAAKRIASLIVDLVAKTNSFKAGMHTASKNTKQFAASVDHTRNRVSGFAKMLIAMATTGAMAIWISSNQSAIDTLAKTADRIGETTERLAGLRLAAEITGASQETLDKSLQKLQKNVSEAASGIGIAKDAIKDLGLSAAELEQMSPGAQFELIAERMKTVETQADRVRIAQALMGRSGVELINTMALGADGLQQFQNKADRLGLSLSRVDAAQVEAANDAMLLARRTITGVGQQIVIKLAPFIEAASLAFVEMAENAGGVGTIIENVINAAVSGFKVVVSVVFRVRQGFTLLGAGVLKVGEFIIGVLSDTERGFRSIMKFIGNLNRLEDAAFAKLGASISEMWLGVKATVAQFVQFAAVKFANLLVNIGIAINRLKGGVGLALQNAGNQIAASFGAAGAMANKKYQEAVDESVKKTAALKDALGNVGNINVAENSTLKGLREGLGAEASRLADHALALESKRLNFIAGVDQTVANIQEKSREAAEQVAADVQARQNLNGVAGTEDPTGETPPAVDPGMALKQKLEQRLQTLQQFNIAEREQININFQLKQEQLRSALANDLLTKEEFAAAETQLEADKEAALQKITKTANKNKLAEAKNAAGLLLALANAFGDKAIGLQKALSLTQAAISISEGIAKAQTLGFPANIGEAARVALVGVEVARSIKSTNRTSKPSSLSMNTPKPRVGNLSHGASRPFESEVSGSANAHTGNAQQAPSKIIIPDSTALDARALAEHINEAGRQGFVFDGIEFAGAAT